MTTIFQSFFSKEGNQPFLEEYIKEEGQMAMPSFQKEKIQESRSGRMGCQIFLRVQWVT